MAHDNNDARFPRKAIILREAALLFREKGYRASTLRELAQRSGIKGGSVYHHFSSKQEILYDIMEHTMSNLLTLEEEIEKEPDTVEKMRKAIRFHIEYHIDNLPETLVADTELRSLTGENYRKIVNRRRAYEQIFIRILEEGSRNGILHTVSVKLSAMAILQMCTGVSYWFRHDGPLTIQEVVDIYVNLICHGVFAQGKP